MRGRLGAKLGFHATEAWEEFRHSPGPNLLAAGTLAAVLFVAGAILLVLANLSAALGEWGNTLRVEIYLEDDARAEEIEALRDRLAALPGVERVEHVTGEEALKRFREAFRSLAAVPEEIGENPLPASLEAYLTPQSATEGAKAVAVAAEGAPGVEEVRWDKSVAERIGGALATARWGGGALGALVFAAIVFVMAAVLRLAVLARRDEIEIMQLVGAGPALVAGPFLLAGAVHGALGGAVATAVLEGARRAALARAAEGAGPLVSLVLGGPLPLAQSAILLATGVGIGVVGAWVAVRSIVR